jgi:hypothetical protein
MWSKIGNPLNRSGSRTRTGRIMHRKNREGPPESDPSEKYVEAGSVRTFASSGGIAAARTA